MKTPLFLDFDRTLFDLDTWWHQYYQWLADHAGTSVKMVDRAAERTRDGQWYDLFAHALALDLEYHGFEEAFTRHTAETTHTHLFPETHDFFMNLNRSLWEPAIITAGHRGAQRRKVEPIRLAVDSIHYSGKKSKASYILELGYSPETELVFIDDAPSWRDAMSATFPNARCYASLLEAVNAEPTLYH